MKPTKADTVYIFIIMGSTKSMYLNARNENRSYSLFSH